MEFRSRPPGQHELCVPRRFFMHTGILTTSGFFGVVIDIMEEVVIVEFGNNKNCRIPMKKDNIVEIDKQSSEK